MAQSMLKQEVNGLMEKLPRKYTDETNCPKRIHKKVHVHEEIYKEAPQRSSKFNQKKEKKTYFEEKKGKNIISKKNLEKQLEQLVLTEIRSPCTDSRASISEKTKQKAYYLSKNRN